MDKVEVFKNHIRNETTSRKVAKNMIRVELIERAKKVLSDMNSAGENMEDSFNDLIVFIEKHEKKAVAVAEKIDSQKMEMETLLKKASIKELDEMQKFLREKKANGEGGDDMVGSPPISISEPGEDDGPKL